MTVSSNILALVIVDGVLCFDLHALFHQKGVYLSDNFLHRFQGHRWLSTKTFSNQPFYRQIFLLIAQIVKLKKKPILIKLDWTFLICDFDPFGWKSSHQSGGPKWMAWISNMIMLFLETWMTLSWNHSFELQINCLPCEIRANQSRNGEWVWLDLRLIFNRCPKHVYRPTIADTQ